MTWGQRRSLRWGRAMSDATLGTGSRRVRHRRRRGASAARSRSRSATAGHRVAFCYSSDADGAPRRPHAAVEAAGAEALAVQADVADADVGRRRVRRGRGRRSGPVELLVNNAGITRDGLLDAHDRRAVGRRCCSTNLTGAFHTIRRATPKMMRARFGRIVNVSSVSGQIGAGRPGQLLGGQGGPARASPGPSPGSSRPAASPATSSPPDLS